jgi:ArsR family transcriptional regulator
VALVAAGHELCVCEMVYALKVPQYRVSKHLSVLARHSIVTSSHRGTWVRYSVAAEMPSHFRECLLALSIREPHKADCARLQDRILLRDEQGFCAVGFVPETELKALIEKARGTCCAQAQSRRT